MCKFISPRCLNMHEAHLIRKLFEMEIFPSHRRALSHIGAVCVYVFFCKREAHELFNACGDLINRGQRRLRRLCCYNVNFHSVEASSGARPALIWCHRRKWKLMGAFRKRGFLLNPNCRRTLKRHYSSGSAAIKFAS